MSGVNERVRWIVAGVLGIPLESVGDRTEQEDVESWDSLAHIHLIGALEAEFSVSFSAEQAIEMTSVVAIREALVAAGTTDA